MIKKQILSILLIFLIFPNVATAMENAVNAENDGRTVAIVSNNRKVCTAFLYSERIVITAGHCLFYNHNGQLIPNVSVTMPGVLYSPNSGDKRVSVEKILYPEDFAKKGEKDMTDRNDFGILILSDPIKILGKTTIANEKQINEYINNKVKVTTIGYGRQSVNHDHNDPTFPQYAQFPLAPLSDVERSLHKAWEVYGEKKYYGMKIHAVQVPGGPSTCGGDSGSPFYIKEGDDFVYLGPLSWGIGGPPLCEGNGWKDSVMYMGSVAAYDYLYLIKQAESYVGIKNNLETTNKNNKIKCIKGKKIKIIKLSNKKCPAGYKLKV